MLIVSFCFKGTLHSKCFWNLGNVRELSHTQVMWQWVESKEVEGWGGEGKGGKISPPHPASSTILLPSHLLELRGLNAKKLPCTVHFHLACSGILLHMLSLEQDK